MNRVFITRLLPVYLTVAALTGNTYAHEEFSPCANRYTPEAQIEMGKQSEQQALQQMPILADNSPVTKYVQSLGDKLTQYAPGYKWPYKFHVATVADINAFALPGGIVFVNLGTIQAAEDEAQLAGVMAHEISHVVLQHSVCNAEKQQRVGLLSGLSQVALGVVLGGSVTGQIADRGLEEVTNLGFLKMSRTDEKQADLEGVGILYDAGYDPHGMPQFFSLIEAKYGEGSAQFLSDHPNPGNRQQYVDKDIATFPHRDNYVTTSPEFERIHKMASATHAYSNDEIASGAWKKNPPSAAENKTQKAGKVAKSGQGQVDTTMPSNWKDVTINGFTVEIPQHWRVFRTSTSALAGPQGRIVRATDGKAASVTYGLLSDVYHPDKNETPSATLSALVQEVAKNSPDMKLGDQREIKVNGVAMQTVECRRLKGRNGESENYWITTLPATNGTVRYIALIAPTKDFKEVRPVFHKVLRSITIQF